MVRSQRIHPGAADPQSFPWIDLRSDLLPDHDHPVEVIRRGFGDEPAKQPGRDVTGGTQLLGNQLCPG